MTSLDKRIAALFRKGSATSVDAEPAPSVDHPIVEEAASEAVVSEPAGEKENETWDDKKTTLSETWDDDKTTLSSQGTMAEKISSPWAGLDLDTAIRLRWA